MRKLLQYILAKPLHWIGNYLGAKPKKEIVFQSLDTLYDNALLPGETCVLLEADALQDKFIVFSDQHKGNRSWADDFAASESSYIAALQHYNEQGFSYINLGDSEELWKFNAAQILPANKHVFKFEAAFQPDRYFKTFGNHDLIWKNKLDVITLLKNYLHMPLPVHEGIIIRLKTKDDVLIFFLTHGHQGDVMSDNNAFSTWVVAHIWMPIQRYLRLNINTPSKDFSLRNEHNQMMHEWSSKKEKLVLITGHTHQPVFASGRYYEHPNNKIKGTSNRVHPSYFNTGCCCFSDGDITGIEIEGGYIRLIKWHCKDGNSSRKILEEISLQTLVEDLASTASTLPEA